MKHDYDYARNLQNTGAQEVAALKKTGAVRKGKAHRGRDLRTGK